MVHFVAKRLDKSNKSPYVLEVDNFGDYEDEFNAYYFYSEGWFSALSFLPTHLLVLRVADQWARSDDALDPDEWPRWWRCAFHNRSKQRTVCNYKKREGIAQAYRLIRLPGVTESPDRALLLNFPPFLLHWLLLMRRPHGGAPL